ncbi:MAG: 4-alpha-glucanotransferase [Labilithrix sp.]|nr:4-alpha-glucanotransferase [Labilithrix sp.]
MSLPTLRQRTSGVLLHLSSLPGPHGVGDLGLEARSFADFLARAGQRWWQMLPVGPVGYGDSPYSALSAFAGNPLFVDLDAFGIEVERATLPDDTVDYPAAAAFRSRHLRLAFSKLDARARKRLDAFCEREASWLDDFALFDALKGAHGGKPWWLWDEDARHRRPAELERARRELAAEITFAKQAQWAFDEQWGSFREYCRDRGIGLIGDVPIFVAHDSADVWQHRELFDLDTAGLPKHIAGVPPDYFSTTGQRWGNPLYRWSKIAKTGYRWWVDRFRAALRRFDVVRLDHFIGFVRYWRIPAHEPTAMNGKWMKGPGRALFDAVAAGTNGAGGRLPLIAEDLGAVTASVTRLRRELGLPGIRLVQFAFGTDPQGPSFLPHNHDKNAVVYTGTHDNDTSVGWFTDPGGTPTSSRTRIEADQERHRALAYMGRDHGEAVDPSLEMMRLAMASVARTCIVPMQDVLGLGTEARMNRPGIAEGNWRWRVDAHSLDDRAESRLRDLARTYGRADVPPMEKQ